MSKRVRCSYRIVKHLKTYYIYWAWHLATHYSSPGKHRSVYCKTGQPEDCALSTEQHSVNEQQCSESREAQISVLQDCALSTEQHSVVRHCCGGGAVDTGTPAVSCQWIICLRSTPHCCNMNNAFHNRTYVFCPFGLHCTEAQDCVHSRCTR